MLPPEESHESPSRSDIYGLATIAGHAATPRALRIKAIRALANIPDQNAIRVLGEMALWEEDEGLQAEAYRSLEATFGDDLPEVLEGIRQELTGEWGGDDLEGETDEDEPEERYELNGGAEMPVFSPAQREEGAPLWLLWAVIGILLLGGLAYYALTR